MDTIHPEEEICDEQIMQARIWGMYYKSGHVCFPGWVFHYVVGSAERRYVIAVEKSEGDGGSDGAIVIVEKRHVDISTRGEMRYNTLCAQTGKV